MSEKDMKLGGIAATKFIDKSLSNIAGVAVSTAGSTNDDGGAANVYSKATSGIYQTSDQVREHYFRQIEQQQQNQQVDSPFMSSNRHGGNRNKNQSTPPLWEERQKIRQLEEEGFRTKDEKLKSGEQKVPSSISTRTSTSSSSSSSSAHVALVRVTTSALEGLAGVLEHDKERAEIPMQDRAAFAKAIQRAMQALAAAKK